MAFVYEGNKTFIMDKSQESISVDKYRALSRENSRFILFSAGLVSFQRANGNHHVHLTHVFFSQINQIRDYERKLCSRENNTSFTERPNKKISVFWATGLKILGRTGTHFFYFFFLEKI